MKNQWLHSFQLELNIDKIMSFQSQLHYMHEKLMYFHSFQPTQDMDKNMIILSQPY